MMRCIPLRCRTVSAGGGRCRFRERRFESVPVATDGKIQYSSALIVVLSELAPWFSKSQTELEVRKIRHRRGTKMRTQAGRRTFANSLKRLAGRPGLEHSSCVQSIIGKRLERLTSRIPGKMATSTNFPVTRPVADPHPCKGALGKSVEWTRCPTTRPRSENVSRLKIWRPDVSSSHATQRREHEFP